MVVVLHGDRILCDGGAGQRVTDAFNLVAAYLLCNLPNVTDNQAVKALRQQQCETKRLDKRHRVHTGVLPAEKFLAVHCLLMLWESHVQPGDCSLAT